MSDRSTKGRLMEHMVFQKTRTQSLTDVRNLNMWGFELDNVSIVSGMTNAETLAFPVNHITTLAPFASCKSLRNLLLRDNRITDFNEIDHLRDLPNLTTLSLSENPIAQDPRYREIVLQKLPQLTKLDDIVAIPKAKSKSAENVTEMPTRSSYDSPISRARTPPRTSQSARRSDERATKQTTDGSMLAAVLSLIPELSRDSLEVVLEAVQSRCK
jgi:hypothetical protein